jgi:hypothetical protein
MLSKHNLKFSRKTYEMCSKSFNHLPLLPMRSELNEQLAVADSLMPRWMQLVDPGIGFSKGKK